MGIKSRCTECGSESTGTGAIVHATTCTANLFIPQTGTGIRYPGTTLIFDTPEEQAKFMKSLKGQVGGTGLRLEDSSQDEGTVTSPKETIEDKLKDHIAKRVKAWFGEPVLAVEDEIQAIITTETTNAYHKGLEHAYRTMEQEAKEYRLNLQESLQKEQDQ